MTAGMVVRPASIEDAQQMAEVHVQSWQETYRGLMPDPVLDAPDFVAARERFWTAALSDPRYAQNRAAIALSNGAAVGIAMAGPPLDDDATWATQLYVLYVLASHHGTGAGTALFDTVIAPDQDASLWVADPNPRAQSFYRRRAFEPDGAVQVEDGVREIRMIRTSSGSRRSALG